MASSGNPLKPNDPEVVRYLLRQGASPEDIGDIAREQACAILNEGAARHRKRVITLPFQLIFLALALTGVAMVYLPAALILGGVIIVVALENR